MSIKVMSRVWENGPQSQGELLVMLALADWSNDQGQSWPSMEGIAQKARLSDARSARRIIRRLEEAGWIEIDVGGGRHGCNKYTINPDPRSPRTLGPPDPERTKPGPSVPQTRTLEPPEPSITVNKPSDVLARVIGEELAEAFIAHRKSIKKPMTEKAAELMAKKLRSFSDPRAAVEEAIMNGWQGVFPPRANQQPHTRSKQIPEDQRGFDLPFAVVK